MGLVDRFFHKQIEEAAQKAEMSALKRVNDAILKSRIDGAVPSNSPVKRYAFDPTYFNANVQQRKKPGGSVSYDTLRRFSEVHEISRACINHRKDQISGLEWDIVQADTEDTQSYDNDVQALKAWFKDIGGVGVGYRKFMNRFIEDLLVIDAIALYRQPTYGGELYTLLPIDATTIRLLVDESGGTPLPPDVAYRQYIRGQLVAEYNTNELLYDMMNPRNNTPYGLAPLESLVVIVSSSLKAGMYNLGYLTDGNVPEGFVSVPENWTPQQIETFRQNFDAALAGDEMATSRLKFLPNGSEYTPTKKREDMQFQEFNDWLMKVTCAIFKVPPTEIGFSPKSGLGGKGFADQQDESSTKKGLKPLVQFIREVFDKIIQEDLGMPHLRFEFKGIEDKDAKAEAETNAVLIQSGQRTINEVRTDEGLDPIDGLDKPLFGGQFQFIDPESIQQSQEQQQAMAEARSNALQDSKDNADNKNTEDSKTKNTDATADLVNDLRKYRRYALGRIKDGKSLRKFESSVLPEATVDEINKRLESCTDAAEARQVFSKYFDEMHINFLADVVEFKQVVNRLRG